MKTVVSILLTLFFVSAPAISQTRTVWITFSPNGEHFEIAFPTQPKIEKVNQSYGPLTLEGLGYSAQTEGVILKLWSFAKTSYAAPLNDEKDWLRYRNACASLLRESLLKPFSAGAPKDHQFYEQMPITTGRKEAALSGAQYYFKLGQAEGAAQIYFGSATIYILAVVNAKPTSEIAATFLRSFIVKSDSVAGTQTQPATLMADPALFAPVPDVLPPPYAYEPVYLPADTTRRARIMNKPEPYYTDGARQNKVEGKVVLRVILTRHGDVIDIREVSGLPYGLTEMARRAAQQIRFVPAQKDGHPVSQYLTVEYLFSPNN